MLRCPSETFSLPRAAPPPALLPPSIVPCHPRRRPQHLACRFLACRCSCVGVASVRGSCAMPRLSNLVVFEERIRALGLMGRLRACVFALVALRIYCGQAETPERPTGVPFPAPGFE